MELLDQHTNFGIFALRQNQTARSYLYSSCLRPPGSLTCASPMNRRISLYVSSWLSSSIFFPPASETWYVWGFASADMCWVLCFCAWQYPNKAVDRYWVLQFPPAVWAPTILFRINGRSISSLAILFAEVLCCSALSWPPLTLCPVFPLYSSTFLFVNLLCAWFAVRRSRTLCNTSIFFFLYPLFPSAPSAGTALHVVARPFFLHNFLSLRSCVLAALVLDGRFEPQALAGGKCRPGLTYWCWPRTKANQTIVHCM